MRLATYDDMEEILMDMEPMYLILDKFSQDCTVETVLHLLMSHFDMTGEQAQAEIKCVEDFIDHVEA